MLALPKPQRVHIAVPRRIWHSLAYRTGTELQPGQFVQVPLRSQTVWGLVVRKSSEDTLDAPLKSVYSPSPHVLGMRPPFLKWLHHLSCVYHYPLGLLIKMAFPPGVLNRFAKHPLPSLDPPPQHSIQYPLSSDQARVFTEIQSQPSPSSHLIYGVTGSGKTELYVHLAQDCLATGKSVLMLAPEIALTPQLVDRMASQLAAPTVVLHSNLTPKQHRDAWITAYLTSPCFVIGTRSALFHPLPNLGLIIMDEEHDASYKQADHLRYHAREVAYSRAQKEQIPWIMGSATPSYEALTLCEQKKVTMHTLSHRFHPVSLPNIQQVQTPKSPHTTGWISLELRTAILNTLNRKKQCLLFLNRKGFAPYLMCQSCGHVALCPHCDSTLTYYKKQTICQCHLCGYKTPPQEQCKQCRSPFMIFKGAGTQAIEEEVKGTFPHARIVRIDRDEITTYTQLKRVLKSVSAGHVDILIGTQMMAKGHDFPDLTLVGILNADQALHYPDYRCVERTAQLIHQVSGRAGRAELGHVILQSSGHPLLTDVITQDYLSLYHREIHKRRQFGLPPIGYLARFIFEAPSLASGQQWLHPLNPALRRLQQNKHLTIVPPAPCLVEKIARKFRLQLLIKSESSSIFHDAIDAIQKWALDHYPRRVILDINPQEFL